MATKQCAQSVPRKRLYSIKELVQDFGSTAWYWRARIWDGDIPAVQVRRKILVDSRDVEAFIEKSKVTN